MLFNKIKALCEQQRISIYQLENAVGLTHGSICKWNDSSPRAAKLKEVADVLGTTVDELLKEEP